MASLICNVFCKNCNVFIVGISTIFQRPLTVPLHSPDGRHLPAVRAMQGDCETVYWLHAQISHTQVNWSSSQNICWKTDACRYLTMIKMESSRLCQETTWFWYLQYFFMEALWYLWNKKKCWVWETGIGMHFCMLDFDYSIWKKIV